MQKLRHHASEHSPFPPKSSGGSISLISDSAQTLPKSLAVGCNAWTDHTPTSATYVSLVSCSQHTLTCLQPVLRHTPKWPCVPTVQRVVSKRPINTARDIWHVVCRRERRPPRKGRRRFRHHALYKRKSEGSDQRMPHECLQQQWAVSLRAVKHLLRRLALVQRNLPIPTSAAPLRHRIRHPSSPFRPILCQPVGLGDFRQGVIRRAAFAGIRCSEYFATPSVTKPHVLCSQSMRQRWRCGLPWRAFKATST